MKNKKSTECRSHLMTCTGTAADGRKAEDDPRVADALRPRPRALISCKRSRGLRAASMKYPSMGASRCSTPRASSRLSGRRMRRRPRSLRAPQHQGVQGRVRGDRRRVVSAGGDESAARARAARALVDQLAELLLGCDGRVQRSGWRRRAAPRYGHRRRLPSPPLLLYYLVATGAPIARRTLKRWRKASSSSLRTVFSP